MFYNYAEERNDLTMIYGYVRISTTKQSIERQVRNICNYNKEALILKETFTGTKLVGRKKLDRLLKIVKKDDTIIFDSVSRMSRNAEEGFEMYQDLFNKDVRLVFLKEPHINTDTYKSAIRSQINLTGSNVDIILKAINEYLLILAKEQIIIAFEQAEKEVNDLHQRTKEGIQTARLNGKQIGLKKGTKLVTNKSIKAKKVILKHNKSFNGTLSNEETWKLANISKTTFYKYKNELLKENQREI